MPNLSYDFTDRTVIVTGAARGIGLEIARFFRTAGAGVVVADSDAGELAAATAGLDVLAVTADVTATPDVERVVAAGLERFGHVDVLVNNAGVLRDAVSWKMTDEDWDVVLAVHTGGAFRFARACIPHFRRRRYGRIINVTSYSGLRGNTGQANYATAKAGVIGMTKTLAKEVARFGITVNAISPSAETRMVATIPADKRREIDAGIPAGRLAAATEMCPAVGFLASEEASYITGIVLPVDGGLSI